MDNLGDLIAKRARPEPPEIAAIKKYIEEALHSPSKVSFQGEAIVVTVASAALANTLRYHATKLKAAAGTEKQLIFRIG
jgi:hypothetical protein